MIEISQEERDAILKQIDEGYMIVDVTDGGRYVLSLGDGRQLRDQWEAHPDSGVLAFTDLTGSPIRWRACGILGVWEYSAKGRALDRMVREHCEAEAKAAKPWSEGE